MYNQQIETFIKVVDVGSFNKAAAKLYITPTAVIKQINLLEKALEVVLFERTHCRLVLTKAGELLYQDAKYIIRYCKDSVICAQNAMNEGANIIRIGSSSMTPAQLLMHRGWSNYVDRLRDDIWQNHSQINIVDFDFYSMNALTIVKIQTMCFWQFRARQMYTRF